MKVKIIIVFVAITAFAGLSIAELPEPSGINPQTGVEWTDGDQYRLVFHASEKRDALSPDIEVYNAWVQGLADAAGLGDITWYAIGSTETVDARENTMTNPTDPNDPNCPVLLLDGSTVVAVDNPDLWDGEIQNIINITEINTVWAHWPFSGSLRDGTKSPGRWLGSTGEVQQGKASDPEQWISPKPGSWIQDPPATLLPMYAMSEALTIGGGDPTAPNVDAGPDKISWTDELVDMTPYVENNGSTSLEYAWTIEAVDPEAVVELIPNSGDPLTSSDPFPTAKVTRTNTGDKVRAKVKLTVNNVGDTNFVSDYMYIYVYDDACAAANAVTPVEYDAGDINKDCITNLEDFAIMALTWLNDTSYTEAMPKL